MLSTAKLISVEKEMESETGDTEYNDEVWRMIINVESWEKAEDTVEENEETEDETTKENTNK